MDFDLFEHDDDDDLLNSVYLEPTQPQTETLPCDMIPEFQCSGEDSLKSQFSVEGFIKNAFIASIDEQVTKKSTAVQEISLTSYNFQLPQLHERSVERFVFGEACMNIQYLMTSVRGPIGVFEELSYYQRRQQVTHLMHLLLYSTDHEQWSMLREELANLRHLLNRITQADTWKLIYFANSSKGNECSVPAYHLLHGALEWKLLDLCILQKYDLHRVSVEDKDKIPAVFISQLERIFEDLLTCSLYLFAKKRTTELLFTSPFPCTCFKEFWLFLQLAVQKWLTDLPMISEEKITFWSLFNNAMSRIKIKMDNFSLTALSFAEFCNLMLNSLAHLFSYRSNGIFGGPTYMRAASEEIENYELCESCTQQFLNSNPNEEQLRIYICLLMPIILQSWRPKVTIPMLLWEHFHKRLNSSFYIPGAAPSNLAVACSSGRSYVDKYRALLDKLPCGDANLSSYTLFALLLGKTLDRLQKSHLNNQTQKLLGRIYTKFSLQKFLALNETGIHHLIELFLMLVLCGDFNELAPKLRDKLLSIAFVKVTTNKQIAVAKGHIALMILFAEQHCDISEYITKLLQQLSSVRNDLAVSKIIADGLLDIFMQADDFRRGEHLLIDAWIPNFLNNCTPAEQERSLEALHLIFMKLQRSEPFVDANMSLFKSLNTFILPFLKQQYVTNFSPWLPQLAADFCTHSCIVADTQAFQKLFAYFIDAQIANRQALPQFLHKILESDKRALVDGTTIMQVWLKSLVLLTAMNEEVVNLTRIIVQLPDFKYTTNLDPNDILKAKEPLCVFVAAIGKNYNACEANYEKRCTIADNFNSYLRNFEKWLAPDVKVEKSELSFRFYSFLAIVIYNCPKIVYSKSKITCFFHIAISRFVLPTSIQMGKPAESKLAQLMHKVWPVIVQGIGYLNFKTDPYINKTLNDLIQKWTPNFKISPNAKVVARPFITCIRGDNSELSLFIFEKLTAMFLATQRRQADANACLVVTIFQEVVDAISSEPAESAAAAKQLETFMKGTCLLTLEHIMMVDEVVPSRTMLLELFKRLIGSGVYKRSTHLKELLAEHLRIITKKHLAYYTFFYFELLMKLVQISYELIEHIMDFLLAEVRIVEQKRGAGEDNRIRGCLQKLQQSFALAKQKCS